MRKRNEIDMSKNLESEIWKLSKPIEEEMHENSSGSFKSFVDFNCTLSYFLRL